MNVKTISTERDEALKIIGFDSYADYLASSLWEWIKSNLVNDASANECYCCKSRTGLAWHHRNYSMRVLVGNFSNSPPVVIRLCSECHEAIHHCETEWFCLEIVDRRLESLRERIERTLFDRQQGFVRSELYTNLPKKVCERTDWEF